MRFQRMVETFRPLFMGSYFHHRRMELFRQLPRTIVKLLRDAKCEGSSLLDVGCWDGEFTVEYARAVKANLENIHGIDFFPTILATAAGRGIKTQQIDLETQEFPLPDASVDVVICNQVLEHLKQVYRPLSEIHRVLKPDGHAVISVPNLAALHNRLLLLFGRQPATIRIMGPHVRGYAYGEFTRFLENHGLFVCERIEPVGMYPFPLGLGTFLARRAPSLCHTPVWLLRKSRIHAPNWMESMQKKKEQTTFFGNDRGSSPIA